MLGILSPKKKKKAWNTCSPQKNGLSIELFIYFNIYFNLKIKYIIFKHTIINLAENFKYIQQLDLLDFSNGNKVGDEDRLQLTQQKKLRRESNWAEQSDPPF